VKLRRIDTILVKIKRKLQSYYIGTISIKIEKKITTH